MKSTNAGCVRLLIYNARRCTHSDSECRVGDGYSIQFNQTLLFKLIECRFNSARLTAYLADMRKENLKRSVINLQVPRCGLPFRKARDVYSTDNDMKP